MPGVARSHRCRIRLASAPAFIMMGLGHVGRFKMVVVLFLRATHGAPFTCGRSLFYLCERSATRERAVLGFQVMVSAPLRRRQAPCLSG